MKNVDYFGNWREVLWQCEHCGWQGIGSELSNGEMYSEVMEMDCPKCFEPILFYGYPPIALARANGSKLSPLDRDLLQTIESSRREFDRVRLKDASQLPDLECDRLVLEWDCDKSAPEIPDRQSPGWQTVIRHGSTEIWREVAHYECYERFLDVIDILLSKYGARLHDLVPTEASCLYLYGDSMSAPDKVDAARARLRDRGTGSRGSEPDRDPDWSRRP
jgi:hypothetical protein